MLKSFLRLGLSPQSLLQRSRLHQVCHAILLGLTLGLFTQAGAIATPKISATYALSHAPQTALPDGVYLYGESDQPDQIGKTYMVIQVKQNQAIGAFYMPQSSFDCFQGTFQPGQLALQVQNSYSQETYPYTLPLQDQAFVAGATQAPLATQDRFSGFTLLKTLSANDQRILNTCTSTQP